MALLGAVMDTAVAKAFLQDFACIVISAIGCILVIPVCAGITAKILKEQ